MFWEKQFDDYVSRLRVLELPLRLRLWGGHEVALGPEPRVTFTIRSLPALRRLLRPSFDSLGRAYVDGLIDVDGPIGDVVALAAKLSAHSSTAKRRSARSVRHSKRLDAEAIAYHYDVSNDFYRLWLDREMVYSCAYFHSPQDSLEAAQLAKLDHILTKIRVQPGQRLLDIGCGWGAMALRAAGKFGAKVVGITLSEKQCELARERVAQTGLEGQVEIRLQDYRDVSETFDRITSVGMLEHVGLKNLRGYFGKIRELLADGGVSMNHGITSTDPDSGESPFGGGEFIERYVFPHGELPHVGFLLREMSAAGLEATDVENLRRHYALTLRHWSRRFEAHGAALREMAGEKRYRIWRTYLAGCAYGFEQGWIALHQVVGVKAGDAAATPLPWTRDYMYGGPAQA